MASPVHLGVIDLPEGILVILDPGLARFWRHDGDPASPRQNEPPEVDLRIVGDDAEAAGRAYDRQFDPLFLFDVRDATKVKAHFDAFARDAGLAAHAEICPSRVPHTMRTHHALEVSKGFGVATYNGLWAVVAGGLPADRGLEVIGEPMPEGEFEGRWRHIDIVVEDGIVARKDDVAGIMVDHGQFLFSGLGPLGHFRMWESLDGLADFVFWGPDAESVAKELGAHDLGDGSFGWKDVTEADVSAKAQRVQKHIEGAKLRVGVDYRPHCNLERLNAQIRADESDGVGSLVLGGARVVGCDNRFGDGIFEVSRHVNDAGRILRIRVEIMTEQRQQLMRDVSQHR